MLRFSRLLASTLIFAGTAGAYEIRQTRDGQPTRWSEQEIAYAIESEPPSMAVEEAEAAVHAAFEAWERFPGSPLRFRFAGHWDDDAPLAEVGPIIVRWSRGEQVGDGSLGETFVMYERTGGRILGSDIVVDEEAHAGEFDLQSTLTHEIGHALGLRHSESTAATMFETSLPGDQRKRTLHDDDRVAIRVLYGGEAPPAQADAESAVEQSACRAAPGASPVGAGSLLMLAFAAARGRPRRRRVAKESAGAASSPTIRDP